MVIVKCGTPSIQEYTEYILFLRVYLIFFLPVLRVDLGHYKRYVELFFIVDFYNT